MTDLPSFIGGASIVRNGGEANQLPGIMAYQLLSLIRGTAHLEIPLNGGSDTRRAIRECWEQRCLTLGIPFRAVGGHTLIIGSKP